MEIPHYQGPSVFGYETDALRRVAAISVHTSPLATLGGKDAGGMNVYIRELSCHTADLGLPVDVFTRRTNSHDPEINFICDNVRVIQIVAGPSEPIGKDQLFQYLPAFASGMVAFASRDNIQYDVLHAHYWLSGWVAHLLRQFWEIPVVQMFHTTAHMKNLVSPLAEHETELRSETEKKLTRLADSLIAANPEERADLIWRQGSPEEKVCTIPPGVDLELFRPMNQEACRRDLGVPTDSRIVLFVGRIDPIKGIDTLIAAIEQVVSGDGPKPMFLFVGGDIDEAGQPVGPLKLLADSVKRLGAHDYCRFVGSQSQDRLPIYYNAADIVVVPSRYESFGLVAVEAMACGTPVIASRAGGLSFTIEDGQSGLLFPVGDAQALTACLNTLIVDENLRADIGAAARQAAVRFAWPVVAAAVHHVYEGLARGKRANLCCLEEIFAGVS